MAGLVNLEASHTAASRRAIACECDLGNSPKRAGKNKGPVLWDRIAAIRGNNVTRNPVSIGCVAGVACAEALSRTNVRANVLATTVVCGTVVNRGAR